MPVRKIKGQCYALNVKGHRGGSKINWPRSKDSNVHELEICIKFTNLYFQDFK